MVLIVINVSSVICSGIVPRVIRVLWWWWRAAELDKAAFKSRLRGNRWRWWRWRSITLRVELWWRWWLEMLFLMKLRFDAHRPRLEMGIMASARASTPST